MFSPKVKQGTRSDPHLIASFMKPFLCFKISRIFPLSQLRDSGAPPGTRTTIWPPGRVSRYSILSLVAAQDMVEAQSSRKKGMKNISLRVRRCGIRPGNTLKETRMISDIDIFAWTYFWKLHPISCKTSKGTCREHSMRVRANQVVFVSIQFYSFYKFYWEKVAVVTPKVPSSDKIR